MHATTFINIEDSPNGPVGNFRNDWGCRTKEGQHWKDKFDKLDKEVRFLKAQNMSLQAQKDNILNKLYESYDDGWEACARHKGVNTLDYYCGQKIGPDGE